jgi:2,4-diketo-3-deoxy-L-fuconate hydrolase
MPGDIVSTGTPFGVGLGRNPKRWLKAGETVTITIEGLGQLINPVVGGPVVGG